MRPSSSAGFPAGRSRARPGLTCCPRRRPAMPAAARVEAGEVAAGTEEAAVAEAEGFRTLLHDPSGLRRKTSSSGPDDFIVAEGRAGANERAARILRAEHLLAAGAEFE